MGILFHNILPRTRSSKFPASNSLEPFRNPFSVKVKGVFSIWVLCIATAETKGISPSQYSTLSIDGVPPEWNVHKSLRR